MQILYVVGDGSPRDNLELRMSLRSIAKYGKNITGVSVVGKPPKWLSPEVSTLEVEDRYSYKHQNILSCIEKAVEAGLVEGDFLYSSDDHFYVKPVDFAEYPYFMKKELRTSYQRIDPFYKYHRSLYDTRKLLEKHNLPTMNYAQHCNTHMHTDIIKEMLPIIHESYEMPFGAEPTSLIMNVWQTKPNRPPVVYRKDVKVRRANTVADIYDAIGDRDCFSIADSLFMYSAIFTFFKKEFPTPCKYEGDVGDRREDAPKKNEGKKESMKSVYPLDLRNAYMI